MISGKDAYPIMADEDKSIEMCRAKRLTDNLVDCLTPNPYRCPYAMSFGWSYFCRHPLKEEIVIRTLKLQQSQDKIPSGS